MAVTAKPGNDGMASDIGQTWAAIERWLAEKAPQALKSQRSGASEAEITDMERYVGMVSPADFRHSLRLHNPGGFVHGFDLLKIESIRSRWSEMNSVMATGRFDDWVPGDASGDFFTPKWWTRRWLPIAEFQRGHICVSRLGTWTKGRRRASPSARTRGRRSKSNQRAILRPMAGSISRGARSRRISTGRQR